MRCNKHPKVKRKAHTHTHGVRLFSLAGCALSGNAAVFEGNIGR